MGPDPPAPGLLKKRQDSRTLQRPGRTSTGQDPAEELTCVGTFGPGHLLGRPGGDDPAAVWPPFGSQVDDVVGGFDHVEVVFDDHDRVPHVHQAHQDIEQFLDVGE